MISDAMRNVLVRRGILREYAKHDLQEFGFSQGLEWDRGFFITGGTGCGKSCLAGALIADIFRRDHPQTISRTTCGQLEYPENAVGWFYASEVPRLVMDAWGGRGEGKAMREILSHKIIVIDDLGSEKQTDHTSPLMCEVIDRCVNGGIGLIVTTNLSLRDIAERDKRIASRLCMLQVVEMPARDFRATEAISRKKLVATFSGEKNDKQRI